MRSTCSGRATDDSVAWAGAPPPTVEDLPDFNITYDAGDVCGFDLRIKSLQNETTIKTFYDSNGDPTREVVMGAADP